MNVLNVNKLYTLKNGFQLQLNEYAETLCKLNTFQNKRFKKSMGQVWWLTPVILAL